MIDFIKLCLFGTSAALLGGAGVAAQAPPPTPREFAQATAQSAQFEILEAETAQAQSRDPRIQAFAQEMIRDHGAMRQAVTQAAVQSGLGAPPMGISPDQSRLLYGLQSLRGMDFDKMYVTQQVLAHHQALVVEEGYGARGSNANLRNAATTAVPLIRHHLDMAQQLKGALIGAER